MMSPSFESKAEYEALMAAYLADQMTAEEMVQAFFKRRHSDADRGSMATHSYHQREEEAWDALFTELFNACDDLDMFPGEEEKASPNWIDEPTFRTKVAELLPRFKAFKLSSLN